MDVHCTTCNEPWDTFHLWQDAIYETGLDTEAVDVWKALPREEKLSPFYRALFKSAGWEFGAGVINIVRCPCCPVDAKPDLERLQTKAALEELLGGDEDGLAATFEDYRL